MDHLLQFVDDSVLTELVARNAEWRLIEKLVAEWSIEDLVTELQMSSQQARHFFIDMTMASPKKLAELFRVAVRQQANLVINPILTKLSEQGQIPYEFFRMALSDRNGGVVAMNILRHNNPNEPPLSVYIGGGPQLEEILLLSGKYGHLAMLEEVEKVRPLRLWPTETGKIFSKDVLENQDPEVTQWFAEHAELSADHWLDLIVVYGGASTLRTVWWKIRNYSPEAMSNFLDHLPNNPDFPALVEFLAAEQNTVQIVSDYWIRFANRCIETNDVRTFSLLWARKKDVMEAHDPKLFLKEAMEYNSLNVLGFIWNRNKSRFGRTPLGKPQIKGIIQHGKVRLMEFLIDNGMVTMTVEMVRDCVEFNAHQIMAKLLERGIFRNETILKESAEYIRQAVANDQYEMMMVFANAKIFSQINLSAAYFELKKKTGKKSAATVREPLYPLRRPIMENRVAFIRLVLLSVNWETTDSYYLRLAAAHGRVEILDAIINGETERPFDLTAANNEMIRVASANGHASTVKLLLRQPEVNPTASSFEAVKKAATNGHSGVLAMLLSDERVSTTIGRRQLEYIRASLRQDNAASVVIADFLQRGAVETGSTKLRNKLRNAILRDNVNEVTDLLSRVRQDDLVSENTNALRMAAHLGAEKVVLYLTGRPDVDFTGDDGAILVALVDKNMVEAFRNVLRDPKMSRIGWDRIKQVERKVKYSDSDELRAILERYLAQRRRQEVIVIEEVTSEEVRKRTRAEEEEEFDIIVE